MQKKVHIFLGVLLLFALLLSFFVYWGVFTEKNPRGEDVVFVVEKGESLRQIAGSLEKENIIRDKNFFVFYAVISGKGKDLKAGTYLLSSSMSVSEIVKEMFRGSENRVTIIEGWNLRDIAGYLEEGGFGSRQDFYQLAGAPPMIKDGELIPEQRGVLREKPGEGMLEGFLFPDTYYISPGTPMEDIVKAMLLNFERRVLNKLEEEIEESEMALYEIITLASLLEKEVTDFDEKRVVAGIIKRRDEIGMNLQIDATITYLTGRRSVAIPITETRIDSPYNTYVYSGLPKGPICNPGIDSIKAALSPKESEYLYYLSKPSGETVFSRTHDEHVEAKNRYLR